MFGIIKFAFVKKLIKQKRSSIEFEKSKWSLKTRTNILKKELVTHPSSIRTTNRFSCNKRIWKIAVDFLLANGGHVSRIRVPCQEHRWRFPYNQLWQNPGTQYARSIRILKVESVLIFWLIHCVSYKTHSCNERQPFHPIASDRRYKIFSCDASALTNNARRDSWSNTAQHPSMAWRHWWHISHGQ